MVDSPKPKAAASRDCWGWPGQVRAQSVAFLCSMVSSGRGTREVNPQGWKGSAAGAAPWQQRFGRNRVPHPPRQVRGGSQGLQRKTFQSQVARARAHPLPNAPGDSPGEGLEAQDGPEHGARCSWEGSRCLHGCEVATLPGEPGLLTLLRGHPLSIQTSFCQQGPLYNPTRPRAARAGDGDEQGEQRLSTGFSPRDTGMQIFKYFSYPGWRLTFRTRTGRLGHRSLPAAGRGEHQQREHPPELRCALRYSAGHTTGPRTPGAVRQGSVVVSVFQRQLSTSWVRNKFGSSGCAILI